MNADIKALPSPWIQRFSPLIRRGGPVLDVAAGAGRHSLMMLDHGHPVTALDRDVLALPAQPGLTVLCTDLEDGSDWPVAGRLFAAIVVTNYLWRPLFPRLLDNLEPNGLLLYETFAHGNQAFGRPSNPDFLLQPGELLDRTQGLTVIAYEHGIENNRRMVQRIAALNGSGPCPLV